MFTLKHDSSLRTHMCEVFHLIFLKQQFFLIVLDHNNVAYEYNISTTPERRQSRKIEPFKKLTSSFQVHIQLQACDCVMLMYCTMPNV